MTDRTKPTERPIPFYGPLVRAILGGRKSETRRVITQSRAWLYGYGAAPSGLTDGTLWHFSCGDAPEENAWLHCPYGKPGDLLWVRERMRVIGRGPATGRPDTVRVRYEADGAESGLLPYPERLRGDPQIGKCLAYGGYREASRILLRVTDVRVERVQDITADGIVREGLDPCPGSETEGSFTEWIHLWDSINAKRGYGWASNPWVWVIGFEPLADTEAG